MEAAPELMQCMEVWGGSDIVDKAVAISGLDAWVYCKPYHDAEGGGDVYYVSSCATGRITRLLVADVSGHGEAVRATARSLRELMRRYVNHIDQSRFVRSMNQQFAALSEDGSFATALVTTFFAPTNHLTLCNAGHPPPMLYRAKEKQWSILEQQGNIPLGIEDVDYSQFDVDLSVGDLVLCYTDSLIESKDAFAEMLGREGLLKVVRGIDVSEPAHVVVNLLARIASLFPGNLSDDDVTVLLFRPNGSASRVSLRNKLFAPLRVLRGMLKLGQPMPLPEISVANIGGALIDRLNRPVSRGTAQRRP